MEELQLRARSKALEEEEHPLLPLLAGRERAKPLFGDLPHRENSSERSLSDPCKEEGAQDRGDGI
jgi:hypothetical protein